MNGLASSDEKVGVECMPHELSSSARITERGAVLHQPPTAIQSS
jgi:hypothetical protein